MKIRKNKYIFLLLVLPVYLYPQQSSGSFPVMVDFVSSATNDVDGLVTKSYQRYQSTKESLSLSQELEWLGTLLYLNISYQYSGDEYTNRISTLVDRSVYLLNDRKTIKSIKSLPQKKDKAAAYGYLAFMSSNLVAYFGQTDFLLMLHYANMYSIRALRLDKDNPYALYSRANHFVGAIGSSYSALQASIRYLERLERSESEFWRYLSFISKANAYAKAKAFNSAYKSLDLSLEIYPNAALTFILEDLVDQGRGLF